MRELPYVVILAILNLMFFSPVILSENSLIQSNASDIGSSFYPYLIFLKNSLDNGILPLWNPMLMGGFPWFGNPESGLFYSFTLIFTILFPPHLAVNYLIIFHLFLTGLFTYFYLREIKIPTHISLFGSTTFMFSGSVLVRIYAGHLSILNSIPWIPLVFLLIEKTIKSKTTSAPVLLGMILGIQALGAQPQILIYTLIASALYFIFRHFSEKTKVKEIFKISIITLLFFFGISAIQLFPSYEMLELSVRSSNLPYEQLTGSSLPPIQLISFILPEFFGTSLDYTTWGASNFWELTSYVGILSLIFVFVSVLIKPDKFSLFFIGLALISILYSIGKFNPLFPLVENIPILNLFRVPSRFLLFFTFSVSIVSAIGLEKFMNTQNKLSSLVRLIAIITVITIFTTGFWLIFKQDILNFAEILAQQRLSEVSKIDPISPTVTNLLEKEGVQYFTNRVYNHIINNLFTLIISLLGFLAIYKSLSKKIINRNLAFILFYLILLFDLWSFSTKYIVIQPISFENTLNLPDDTLSYRIVSPPEIYLINQAELDRRNIQRFDGYYVAKLSYYDEFFEASKTNAILTKLGNVKYSYTSNGTAIYQESLPRAFFVYANKIIENNESHLALMLQENFDPTKTLLVDNKIVEIKEIIPLKIISYKPNSLKIEINNTDKGFLVLLDTWYPGWKIYANADGKPVKRAYHIMRGIEINEPTPQVKFSFEPRSFYFGSYVTGIAFIVILGILITACLKKKSQIVD